MCCAQDCEISDWSEWGGCNATCGGGEHTRFRVVLKSDSCGGIMCPDDAEMMDVEDCNTEVPASNS